MVTCDYKPNLLIHLTSSTQIYMFMIVFRDILNQDKLNPYINTESLGALLPEEDSKALAEQYLLLKEVIQSNMSLLHIIIELYTLTGHFNRKTCSLAHLCNYLNYLCNYFCNYMPAALCIKSCTCWLRTSGHVQIFS